MMRTLTLGFVVAGCVCTFAIASPRAQSRAGDAPSSMPGGIQSARLPDGTLMLTNGKGMTLYTFARDTPQQSNCNDNCAVQWPPVPAEGAPPSDAWTVITRMDGSKQWAYRGMPLYGWIKDTAPGDITGDGVANRAWKIAAVDTAPNMIRIHLAHISTMFPAAPNHQGLLPVALAEANTAAQHAALAEKASGNLDAMRLHAGHVMHVIDPSLEPAGPGLGFGVKRAAAGIAEHVQLATKSLTVSTNVMTLAGHVLLSANNTVKRCDEIVAVARRIRAAATAADAAPDVARLSLLTQELTAGLDINKDGQVGWQTGEGGLAQVEAQMKMMMKGEGS
jgi:predicted lipoprotein with Yx(FWY)xxD motif